MEKKICCRHLSYSRKIVSGHGGWILEETNQADQSRVRIHTQLGEQPAGVEVSADPRGEALCCLLHFMLLMEPGNPGLQLAIQSQKDIKEPQGES